MLVFSFFVLYYICQNIDGVNEENWQNVLINIIFLPIFYQYLMNKPSYYFYLKEFCSHTLLMGNFKKNGSVLGHFVHPKGKISNLVFK